MSAGDLHNWTAASEASSQMLSLASQQQSPSFGPTPLPCRFFHLKNARDMCTVTKDVQPQRLLRSSAVSAASVHDRASLQAEVEVNTYLDLRSSKEIKEDENTDWLREFPMVEYHKRSWARGDWTTAQGPTVFRISLVSESIIRKESFKRMDFASKVACIGVATAGVVSRRCRQRAKKMHLDVINHGGLVMLNECILRHSKDEICAILKLLSEPGRLPAIVFCTAGKDRTGLIIALILSVLSVNEDDIVEDYMDSDSAYQDLESNNSWVMALERANLRPKVFLGAPEYVMRAMFERMRAEYGSVMEFLDSIGFHEEDRAKLRAALKKARE